jgi:hypothetical protein
MSPEVHKSNFFSEHFDSQDFDFVDFDVFGGILDFRYVVFELFAGLYFTDDVLGDMLMGEDWYYSFLQGKFKYFLHIYKFVKIFYQIVQIKRYFSLTYKDVRKIKLKLKQIILIAFYIINIH